MAFESIEVYERRFWRRINENGPIPAVRPDLGRCWIWTGSRLVSGYGHLKWFGKFYTAHRLSYVLANGPIDDSLVVDHLCMNRSCVNPDHLDPVTHRENIARARGGAQWNAEKTHCPRGHEYTPDNTYVYKGRRNCRTCIRALSRDRNRLARARSRIEHPERHVLGKFQRSKTHCPQGHPYDETNTLRQGNGRACRACNREKQRQYQARKRAVIA